MRNMLLASVAAISLSAVGVSAQAADYARSRPVAQPIYAAPASSWSDCYVGVQTGWGWGTKDSQGIYDTDGDHTSWLSNNIDVSGALFGGQVGCNFTQYAGILLGVEASFAGTDINGLAQDDYCFGGCSAEDTAKMDALGSITGRIGWSGLSPNMMFYVKGGWAWAHDRYSWNPSTYDYSYTATQTRSGWTLGFGGEMMLVGMPGTSIFAEFDYYDFGTKNVKPDPYGGYSADITQKVSTVKVGANFRFSGL